MQITEVRIKLMESATDRLRAFCSITIDDAFVVRDLKIIDGASGPFVAMPSRKLTGHCTHCGSKNHLRANYCNQCGARQPAGRPILDEEGRARLYADIAHPINSECREMIQEKVIETYQQELELAKQPGYVSRYDDFDADYDESESDDREKPAAGGERLGTIPPPPEKSDEPQPKAEKKPTSSEDKPAARPESAQPKAPHSKQVQEQKEQKTPWHKRPDDEFGAGIF